jgi:hypothetical protein
VQRPQGTALKLPFRRPLLAGSGHQQHLHLHPKSRDALDAPQDRIPQQPIAPDFLANRWKEMGEPSLMRQHKYSLLLRSIRAEKRLVALELLDLMLEDTCQQLDSI